MDTTTAPSRPETSTTDAGSWESSPLPPAQILDGDPAPRVHWLHRSGAGEPVHKSGLWEVQPARFRWIFSGNESFHVLSGRATIVTDDGVRVEVAPGDLAFFPAGTHSIWTVAEPLRKFFAIS